MMNKINKFPHLTVWCKEYFEKVGLKIHPSTVPTDVIIDELMGRLAALENYSNNLLRIYESANERIAQIEEKIIKIESDSDKPFRGVAVPIEGIDDIKPKKKREIKNEQ